MDNDDTGNDDGVLRATSDDGHRYYSDASTEEEDDDDDAPTYCTICLNRESWRDGDIMLVCDGCDATNHPSCAGLPPGGIPNGDWLCHRCHKVALRQAGVRRLTREAFLKRYAEWYSMRMDGNRGEPRNGGYRVGVANASSSDDE